MRHRKKGNHLGRTASHKKALMRNLAAQVFEYKEIRTTLAKAKELRSYVERLITYGKKGTLHHRRLAFQFLQNKQAVKTLFDEIAPLYEDRAGGYTRIIKLGNRKGDNAPISIFQLVGFEKVKPKEAKKKKKSTTKPQEKEALDQQKTEATEIKETEAGPEVEAKDQKVEKEKSEPPEKTPEKKEDAKAPDEEKQDQVEQEQKSEPKAETEPTKNESEENKK